MVNLSRQRIYQIFSILDSAIALFLVFPLACLYWRGAWELIGYYVLRDRKPLCYWVYFAVGNLQMVGLLLLPFLDEKLDRSKKIKFWIVTRVFMYLHTLTYMFYWHGLWLLMNHYFGVDWEYNLVSLIFAWLALCVLGSCRSVMWPPFFVSVDDQPDMLQATNRFKVKIINGQNWKDYITDCYFSQIIILGLAIVCWRSLFNIYDRLFISDDTLKSNVWSVVVGVAGSIILLSLQIPLGGVSKTLAQRRFLKILWEDVVYSVTFVILAFLWRGVWNLSETYFLPEKPLGSWVNLALGSVGMIGMHIFTEVSAFGIEEDGLDPGGEAFYPVKYLRILFSGHCTETPIETNQVLHENNFNPYDNPGFSSKELEETQAPIVVNSLNTSSSGQLNNITTAAPPSSQNQKMASSTRQRTLSHTNTNNNVETEWF